jgi:hypothetical protein
VLVANRCRFFRLPFPHISCDNVLMRRLLPILCLTLAVLLGGAGEVWSADFQKGLDAAQGLSRPMLKAMSEKIS